MRVQIGVVCLFFDVEGARLVPDGPQLREKPTWLLLHGGLGFDHSSLKPWFSALQDVAQLVYLDHRGNWQSDHGAADRLNLNQWGDDGESGDVGPSVPNGLPPRLLPQTRSTPFPPACAACLLRCRFSTANIARR
jgi:pimeloyl-ACP methyl ester carboxylesterase